MSDASLIGQTLGQVRLVSQIGKGEMGAVYRGEDGKSGRDVAVKVIFGRIAHQPTFKERFLKVARDAESMMHPGVVQVYHAGEESERLYLVSEYVRGPSLADMLEIMASRRQLVPLREAAAVVEDLAITLGYAHRRGVLHLGLKPSNVLFRAEASARLPFQPLVSDLGLAGLLDQEVATQQFAPESLAYMAPEQVMGTQFDGRSDIYSLGVMFFELLTGQRLFRSGNLMEAIRAHSQEQPPEPKSIRVDIPPEMSRIALKAMAKKPEERYQSAEEMADALRTVAETPFREKVAAVSLAKSHPELARTTPPADAGRPKAAAPPVAAATAAAAAEDEDTLIPGVPGESGAGDQLIIQHPDLTTHFYRITSVPFSIGSDPARNQVVLPFEDVGARHASVDFDGVDYYVDDLGSSGGTYLASAQLLPGLPERWLRETPMLIGKCRILLGKAGDLGAGAPVEQKAGVAAVAAAAAAAATPDDVAIRLATEKLTVRPGGELAVPMTILNQSRLVDHFGLSIAGIPEAWVTAPPEAHLFPGDQRELSLIIRPPLEAASRAGVFPIDILVTSRAMSRTVGKRTVELIVEPFFDWRISLEPQRTKGTAQGRFTVNIANDGNAPLELELSAADQEGACRFQFDPSKAAIPAGEKQDIQLVVSHIYSAPAITEHTYHFSVKAAGEKGQEKQASGDWVHTPPSFDIVIEPEQLRTLAQGVFRVVITNPERIAPHAAENQEAIEEEGILVDLLASDPQAGCEYVFVPSELKIPPGESRETELTVTPKRVVPEVAVQAHDFTVRASLRDTGVRQQAGAVWAQISPHFALNLTEVRPEGSVSGEFALTVSNNSEAEMELALSAAEGSGACIFDFSTTGLTLPPHGEEAVQLTVHRVAGELATEDTEHPFSISVWPVLVPKAEQSIDGVWRQTAPDFTLKMQHTGRQTLRQGNYLVLLENQEPVDLALVLSAADPLTACSYRFANRQLIIPANGQVTTELSVQPQRPLAGTEPVVHTFNVRADLSAARGVYREADGQWTQRLPNFSLSIRVDEGQGVARGLYVVEMANDESEDLIIDLQVTDQSKPAVCNFRLAAGQVNVPANNRRKVQLLVERADHTLTDAPRTHAFMVTARAGDAPKLLRQATEKWVQIAPSFEMRILGQSSLERRRGEYQVELRNTTPIELPIALTAEDKERACQFELSAKQVRLAPGQVHRVGMSIQGRQDILGIQGRTHQFRVTASLTNVQGVSRQSGGTWVQVPAALTLQLSPTRRRGGNQAEFTLTAQNESGVPLTMAATAGDPDNNLRYQFTPPQIAVPPAESRTMKMKASALARIPRGEEPKTHPIAVAVTAAEAPMFVERLQAEWEELPRGRFSCGCILAVGMAVILLFALLFAALYTLGYLPF